MDTIHANIDLDVLKLENTIHIIQCDEIDNDTFLFIITTKSKKYYIIRYVYCPEEKKYCEKTKCKIKLNNSSISLSIIKTNNEDDVLDVLYKVCSDDYQLDGRYDRTNDGYAILSKYIDRHKTLRVGIFNVKNYTITNAFLQSIYSFYDKECNVSISEKYNFHKCYGTSKNMLDELTSYLYKFSWMREYIDYFVDKIKDLNDEMAYEF